MIDNSKPKSRKIQAKERRLQILDIALLVFADKGFTKTTIKDIADAASISVGLMYHYFPGKEKLLEAAVERHSFLPQLRDILMNTGKRHCRDVLRDISLKFIKLLNQKKMITKIFLQESYSNAKVRRVWSNIALEGVTLLQKYLSANIATGELRPHNTEVIARFLFSNVIMYHFTQDVFKASKVTKSQFIDEMLNTLLQGIRNTEQ